MRIVPYLLGAVLAGAIGCGDDGAPAMPSAGAIGGQANSGTGGDRSGSAGTSDAMGDASYAGGAGSAIEGGGGGAGGSNATEGGADVRTIDAGPTGPSRRGIWVWDFGIHAESVQVVAARSAALGIGTVLIKSGEDYATWDFNFNPTIISAFTSKGIEVWGWAYVRSGGNLQSKAAELAKQGNLAGVKGIILDVEWEWFDQQQQATAICKDLRGRLNQGKLIGYSAELQWTYGGQFVAAPQYFPQYPWKEFDQDCGDASFPQVYWPSFDAVNRNPDFGWKFVTEGAAKLGLKAPIWAIQDAGAAANSHPASIVDVNAFFRMGGDHISLWRWPDPGSALLGPMADMDWKGLGGPAGLGACQSKGLYCGSAQGAPAGSDPQALYSCSGPGADWILETRCATKCYVCPPGAADTCEDGSTKRGCN